MPGDYPHTRQRWCSGHDQSPPMTRLRVSVLVLLLFCVTSPAVASEVSLLLGGQRFNKPITSWRDIRRQHVVMQALDFSCGAAALATVLRYGFAEEVNETEIIGF